MTMSVVLGRFREARSRLFFASRSLSLEHRVALAVGMCFLTALLAKVRFYLPSTPVPVTGQVLAVLLSGVLLGHGFGALSQVLYLGLGVLGIPWFASAQALRLGPTGGYLFGFVAAAAMIGWVTDRCVWARRFLPQLGVMVAGVGVIYVFGAVYYGFVMRTGFSATVRQAVAPFVWVDLAKAVLAAATAFAILPKRTPKPGSN